MYNKIILQGNLTIGVELKYTKEGTVIASSAIAVTEKYKDKETTLFVDITIFGKQAEIFNQYLNKGSKVLIDGKLRLDSWTDDNNQKRYRHSVLVNSFVMLDCKKSNTQQPKQQSYSNTTQIQGTPEGTTAYANTVPEIDIDNEEELPF